MNQRIAVNLGRRGEQKTGTVVERQFDHRHRTEPIDCERSPGIGTVSFRTSRRGKMIDAIDLRRRRVRDELGHLRMGYGNVGVQEGRTARRQRMFEITNVAGR